MVNRLCQSEDDREFTPVEFGDPRQRVVGESLPSFSIARDSRRTTSTTEEMKQGPEQLPRG